MSSQSGREGKQQDLGEARASERALGVLVEIGVMKGSFGGIESSWDFEDKRRLDMEREGKGGGFHGNFVLWK